MRSRRAWRLGTRPKTRPASAEIASEKARTQNIDLRQDAPRQPAGEQQAEPPHSGDRQQSADDPADQTEDDVLGDELSQNATTTGTESGTYRQLTLTHLAASEQEIGDVGAGDQQDEETRALDEAEELYVGGSRNLLAKRPHDHAGFAIGVRVGLLEPGDDRGEIGPARPPA